MDTIEYILNHPVTWLAVVIFLYAGAYHSYRVEQKREAIGTASIASIALTMGAWKFLA